MIYTMIFYNVFYKHLLFITLFTSCLPHKIGLLDYFILISLWNLTSLCMKDCGIISTWFMVQSFMQNFLTALILLHLHQQLSQVITQEVMLRSLQGCFIVIYCLCNGSLVSTLFFFPLLWVIHVYVQISERHKPWCSCESWPGFSQSCLLKHHLWGFSSGHVHKLRRPSLAEDKQVTQWSSLHFVQVLFLVIIIWSYYFDPALIRILSIGAVCVKTNVCIFNSDLSCCSAPYSKHSTWYLIFECSRGTSGPPEEHIGQWEGVMRTGVQVEEYKHEG